jgi:hypothetical protein
MHNSSGNDKINGIFDLNNLAKDHILNKLLSHSGQGSQALCGKLDIAETADKIENFSAQKVALAEGEK